MTRLERRNYGRGHGYRLDGEKIVGVTTALGVLAKPALVNWAADQAARRAVDEWDRLSSLPVSDRLEFIKRGPRDVLRAAALRGTEIHALGEQLVHGDTVDVPDEHKGPVEAYARFLDEWQIDPIASETPVASITHRYGGTADLWCRIGIRGGAVALVDIKTGKGVYDETAFQLAAYRYSELIQPEKGVEIPTPAVDMVYVAHVLPDAVRMVPVVADEQTFRSFLYILQVYRAVEACAEWPLIGSAESA